VVASCHSGVKQLIERDTLLRAPASTICYAAVVPKTNRILASDG
jgi:hypothetical protein